MTYDKQLTIGLIGFGVVGGGIYKVLQQTPTLNATIKKICIKHPEKERDAPAHLFTTDASILLDDPSINVIVELIDDADAAFEIVRTAMLNQKSAISANKKMIAEHLQELLQLQEECGVSFLYEAAVCGSIPVIRNLEEYYDNDLLNSVSGIVNGSTNYILTKMNDECMLFDDALREAQRLGFAETDPSLDVEGKDAVNKLTIILLHAYGIVTQAKEILHLGITQLHADDARYAREKGYNIKLVANARRIGNEQIAAYVLPTFVGRKSQLHFVRNEFNGVLIGSKLADEQFIYGKGAGRYPTSSAVLSDISALRYDYRYEYKKSRKNLLYSLSGNHVIRLFVSYSNEGDVDPRSFIDIEETYHSHQRKYMVGTISLDSLREAFWLRGHGVSVIEVGDQA